jgi:GAF domain-containing protein
MTYREGGLDEGVVVLLERGFVAVREPHGQLLGRLAILPQRVLQPEASEGEPAEEPHEPLRRRPLLPRLELVLDELLEGRRLGRVGSVARAYFL